jgi:hypothetical protein
LDASGGSAILGYATSESDSSIIDLGATGFAAHIGFQPEWSAFLLNSTGASATVAAMAFDYCMSMEFGASAFNVHFRNEAVSTATGKQYELLLFEDFKNSSFTESWGGPNPITMGGPGVAPGNYLNVTNKRVGGFETAHFPGLGYMGYLLTGWYTLLEELYCITRYNYLDCNYSNFLAGGNGWDRQVYQDARRVAWINRTSLYALVALPDSESRMRSDLMRWWESNITIRWNKYVDPAGSGYNVIGWCLGISDGAEHSIPEAPTHSPLWDWDWWIGVYAWAQLMEIPQSATAESKMRDIVQRHGQTCIKRFQLGVGNEMCYKDGANYQHVIYNTGYPHNSPTMFLQTWPEIELASSPGYVGVPCTGNPGYGTEYNADVNNNYLVSFNGNALPTLAMLTDLGLPGASAAWSNETNTPGFVNAQVMYPDTAVWGIFPRS